ncbi:hypothetical protein HHK36_018246 [Tetracentron sinense]|uniref:TFIIF beta subunit HTH domain-containing protein n=1 Tax=Tetracentron sinense TaxID=13715 RepID=A0A834Z463_TETSI|nr:hypothetical protein HHK36_018246 [Tetracentron sinense]
MDEQEQEQEQGSCDLETSKADRAVWLMKFPPVVSRSWQNHSSSDSPLPLAKVLLSIDPLRPNDDTSSSQRGCLPDERPYIHGPLVVDGQKVVIIAIVLTWYLTLKADMLMLNVLKWFDTGSCSRYERSISLEGKVLNKFDMKPHNENIGDYGKLCRERTQKYMTKSRQIQVIDNDRGMHMRPMPGMAGLLAVGSKDKKKTMPLKGSDMKRTRRERGVMEAIMFKLFERKPNWTLRHLILETDQPEQFLKDILKDLCVYNNKGTNQGTYQLKPEYKRSSQEQAPD